MNGLFMVGDRVSVDHPKYPGVWIVRSKGPVNSTLIPEQGGRGLRVPHHMLTEPGAVLTAEPTESFHPGEFVRIPDGRFAGLYVVLADKGDKVNVAAVGGDGGRYVRAIRRSLTKVDSSEVMA